MYTGLGHLNPVAQMVVSPVANPGVMSDPCQAPYFVEIDHDKF